MRRARHVIALRALRIDAFALLSMRFSGFLRKCAAAPPPLGFFTGAHPARLGMSSLAEERSSDAPWFQLPYGAAQCVICCRWASKKALAVLPMSIRGRIFCSLLYAFFYPCFMLARLLVCLTVR